MDILPQIDPNWLLPEKQYAFGYVAGVVFGDGSISKETNVIPHTCKNGEVHTHLSTIYLIRLQVTSQAFAERFASQWEILIGRPAKLWTTTRTNFNKSTLKGRSKQYNVQLFNFRRCHVPLGRYLAHLKYESEPSELLSCLLLEAMRGFVHGMIDSEGYLNQKKPGWIDIANKDIKLLDTIAIMLTFLGFSGKVYTYPSQNVSHLVTFMPYAKYGHSGY